MLVVLIGLIAGILSGLAIGGGTVLVPALVLLVGLKQQVAQGVTLAAFLPTAMIAAITHYRHGNVKLKLALLMAVGTGIGACAGATLATSMSEGILRRIFGLFLIAMGLYELLAKDSVQNKLSEERK